MHLVRYCPAPGQSPAIGLHRDGMVAPLPGTRSLAELLSQPVDEIRARCDSAVPLLDAGLSIDDTVLQAPIDGLTELWAAGVTYKRSREARVAESVASADVYERVYDADRPELFFKAVSWRVVPTGRPIGVRSDSAVNVPEPELAVVVNSYGETVGYTVCNDVSSRSIEGDNPLYLPQAKVYLGSAALGPMIRPVWELDDPYQLDIGMQIWRDGALAWDGTTSTALLNRTLDELVGYLMRADVYPAGAVLATGTCLVPDLPFTLLAGDRVTISISQVGTLVNDVVVGKAPMAWLADALQPGALQEGAADE